MSMEWGNAADIPFQGRTGIEDKFDVLANRVNTVEKAHQTECARNQRLMRANLMLSLVTALLVLMVFVLLLVRSAS